MNMIGSSFRLPPSNPTRSSTRMFSGKASFQGILEAKPKQTTIKRPNSLYEVLRVERNATPLEIKTAYRSLAKIYHPDASEFKQHEDDDHHDFIEIHNAYATLSNPEARAMYDQKWRRKTGLYMNGFNTTRRWETDQCW